MSKPNHNQLSNELGPTQLIAVSSLKYPKSFRIYQGAVIRKAARFIEAFGLRVPVLIDRERNIICGELWALAHKHLGLATFGAVVRIA